MSDAADNRGHAPRAASRTAGRSGRVFYGWFIIAAAALGICFAQAGVVNFGFSSFLLPLQIEFGFGRGAISLAFTAAMLAYTVSIPFVGGLIDSYGVRRVLLVATAVFGLLVCSMYFLAGPIWHLYAMYALLGMVGSATSMVSYSRLAVSWFDKRKGLALALAVTGAGVAAVIVPPLVEWIIRASTWRLAYLSLGAINLLVCLPLLYGIVRNSPEEKQTWPDGIAPSESNSRRASVISIQGYTFGECVRSSRFWRMAAAFTLLAAAQLGPVAHLVPLLVDAKFTDAGAAAAASSLGVALIFSRLVCGYLLDRFFAPRVAAVFLIAPVLGFTALAMAPGYWTGIVATVSLGLALGAEFDVMPFFCTQYFGRLAFGKIYGLVLSMFSLATGASAFLTGVSYDVFSSYAVALSVGAAITLVAVMLILSLGPYPELPECGADPSRIAAPAPAH